MDSIKDFIIAIQVLQVEYFCKVSVSIKTILSNVIITVSDPINGDTIYYSSPFFHKSEYENKYNEILNCIRRAL